jgi:transposase
VTELFAVRAMSEEEGQALRELAHSRTAEARLRDRARICWLSHQGQRVRAIQDALHIADGTVRLWITRFNAEGLDGLRDRRRGGRPATYTPEQVGELIAASLTDPQELGVPFGSWTLDRLAT